MPKDASVSLEVDGLRGRHQQPGQGVLPGGRGHQARPGELLPGRGATVRCAACCDRPMALKRFVDGAAGEAFFQKRAPASVPEYVRTVELSFPSGRTADEVVVTNRAALAWVVNLGCIDLNPHPVRADDLDHPDELRVDLDPGPGVPWADVRRRGAGGRARCSPITAWSAGRRPPARAASTSTRGSSRAGASARCAAPRWPWRARSSGARPSSPPASGGRRSGTASSSTTTRTPRTAPWPRPTRCGRVPDARVSAPLTWDEVPDAELGDFTLPHHAGAIREARRRGRGDRRRGRLAGGAAGAVGSATRRRGWATRRGRRTTPSSPASRRASSRRSGGCAWPDAAAARAGVPVGSAQPMPPPPARRADGTVAPTGRRRSAHPLIVISQAKAKEDALDGLERWKKRHPKAAKHLAEDDVLVDGMRGRSSLWYRVRVNLRHVPEEERPGRREARPRLRPLPGVAALAVTLEGAFHAAVRNDPHRSHRDEDRHRHRRRHERDRDRRRGRAPSMPCP